jgi:phosphoribosyl 1,2-cyclic phosphate phosphodiesterase
MQALRSKIERVDAVLYTHPHSDHVLGIDELRSYNFLQGTEIPVYGNGWTCSELPARFDYVFNPPARIEGGGIPRLVLNPIESGKYSTSRPLLIQGVPVVPIPLSHGSKEVLAYRIDSIAYVTDTSYIPSESLDQLRGLSVLVLDCLRLEPHGTHFNLDQALEVISQLRPKKTFLTHLGHDFEYAKWSRKLPKGVFLAYDGLTVRERQHK